MNKVFSTRLFCEWRCREIQKSVISLPLCKCMWSHELAQILSSSGERPKLWVC